MSDEHALMSESTEDDDVQYFARTVLRLMKVATLLK